MVTNKSGSPIDWVKVILDAVDSIYGDAKLRPVTRKLLNNLSLDLPLSPAQITDFGVETDQHYRALRGVLFSEERSVDLSEIAEQFEEALGNGPKLTALVEKYAPEYKGVVFKTDYDEFLS